MKLIVGLGNPGTKYAKTRHNTGFMFLDYFASFLNSEGVDVFWENSSRFKAEIAEVKYKGSKMVLMKPHTYMNESGWSVQQFLSWHKVHPKKLLLIHDDLDIPLGKFKANTEKSPKVHYGVMSIEGYLHTKNFTRIRIGVDNRGEGDRRNGVAYVMENFSGKEQEMLEQVYNEALPEVLAFIRKGAESKQQTAQSSSKE